MIKMVVTDLDGTLLRTDKSVSPVTAEVLARLRQRGIKVVYATGRGGSAGNRAPSHWFDGRILMNGAMGYDGGALVYRRLIPMDMVRGLLLKGTARGIKMTAELSGMHYANFDTSAQWADVQNFVIADFQTLSIDPEKVYAVIEKPEHTAFLEANVCKPLYMTVSRDNLAQVMHEEATKAKAIKALSNRWGIAMSEIAAFGDDLNDIDMLTACGYGVAMGNAVPEVKAAAAYACGENDEDGMAKWLVERVLAS